MKIQKTEKMKKKNLMSPTLLVYMFPTIPPSSLQFLEGVRCSFDTVAIWLFFFNLQMNHENFITDYMHTTKARCKGGVRSEA